MTAQELFDKFYEMAQSFGLHEKNDKTNTNKQINVSGNAIIRKNIHEKEDFKEGKAYFGFINPEEELQGIYSDYSLVIFPDDKDEVENCLITLVIGTNGFKNDYYLASLPKLRRHFIKLKGENTFFKSSFADMETPFNELYKEIKNNKFKVSNTYKPFITAARILKIKGKEDTSLAIIKKMDCYLCIYSRMAK